jgi:DNA polymerase III subunit gamma/tau
LLGLSFFFNLEVLMLALKYRPQRFEDIIGQNTVNVFLSRMTARNKLPNLLIFDGIHGSGKTSSARVIGAAMNCTNPPAPCGKCEACKDVFDGISMSVTEIDAASHGKVADMEALRESLYYSNGTGQRLVILDEAHAISREGFKSMLKTFEESPPGVIFILVTTEFRRIPETIVSRAMRFTFTRVPMSDITARLTHVNDQEHLDFEADLILRISEKANGSMRDALMLMDKLARVGITTVSDYVAHTKERDLGPALLLAMLENGAAGAMKVVAEEMKLTGDAEIVPEALTNLFRDLLLLRNNMPVARQGEALEVRKKLAGLVEPAVILNALRVLWDLKTKFQHSEAYYEVYLAATMVGELFGKSESKIQAPVVSSVSKPAENRKLSLAELGNV